MPDYQHLAQLFFSQAARYQHRTALMYRKPPSGRYVGIRWDEWAARVRETALGLAALGVQPGDRIGILCENRPEWSFADLGILSLGAASVPIYPTLTAAEIQYVIENAGIKILFLSTVEQWEKIQQLLHGQGPLEKVIALEPIGAPHAARLDFAMLLATGRRFGANHKDWLESRLSAIQPDDLATIIYTSGTTGPPKGVMLTHRNFIENYLGAKHYIDVSDRDIALSFLPLSHVFERLAGYYFMLANGATIVYAQSMKTVAQDIVEVKPTVAAAVPRFYEKVYAGAVSAVESGGHLKKTIFYWACRIGKSVRLRRLAGQPVTLGEKLQYRLADLLVFHKIRARLGGRLRYFISGGAPLGKDLAEFFYAAGVMILEGYGLTETAPVIAVNSPDHFRFGTVGRVLPNVEVKIAADGEILTRGPCIMKGYYKREDATAEVIKDGWFHTGDIGHLDPDGFLTITDRKKDIIVTSGGKNIAPQNIENLIISDPLFLQAVILGDKRNYIVALLVPAADQVRHFAEQQGIRAPNYAELLRDEKVYQWVKQRLREKMHALAAYEQVKYFALLEREFTMDAGELTPTLKVKRRVVAEKYKTILDELYRKGEAWAASVRANPEAG